MRASLAHTRWTSTGAWRLLPAAAIALAAHAVLYGAWAPADQAHSYFSWYEPLVAGAGVALLPGLVLAGLLARRVTALRRLIPPTAEAPGQLARRLWLLALAWLALQETLEASYAAGGVAVPILDARQLALVLLASGLGALLAAWALGGSLRLARALLGRAPAPVRRPRPAVRRAPAAPLAWALVWLVHATGRRGPPVAA